MGIVFSNLRVLMAERNLSIKEINEGTNLSRTTISNLVNNNANGVQYDTLKQLCEFLNCDVGDIIQYSTLEIHSFILEDREEYLPTQYRKEVEWYKEKDLFLNIHLSANDKNLMIGVPIKIQEGYQDKEKKNIIHGIFYEDKLYKSINKTFGNSILTEAFLEEILSRITMKFNDYDFTTKDSLVTYSIIVY